MWARPRKIYRRYFALRPALKFPRFSLAADVETVECQRFPASSLSFFFLRRRRGLHYGPSFCHFEPCPYGRLPAWWAESEVPSIFFPRFTP